MTDQDQPAPQKAPLRYPLRFRFTLGAADFDVNVTLKPRGPHLFLRGTVATLPYSVEAPGQRADILKSIAGKGPDSPWDITPQQRLVLNTEFYLSGQPSLIRFFTEALRAALVRTPAAALG